MQNFTLPLYNEITLSLVSFLERKKMYNESVTLLYISFFLEQNLNKIVILLQCCTIELYFRSTLMF